MKRLPILVFGLVAALLFAVAAASGNEDCSDAIDLTGMPLPLTVTGTTAGKANDYGPFPDRPDCWQGERWRSTSCIGGDATYKWTAPAAGLYTFSTCHSEAFNTDILLYDDTCPDEPRYPEDFICGNDARCPLNALLKDIPLAAGQEVLIVVDSGPGGEGPFELDIAETTVLETAIEVLMDAHRIPGTAATVVGPEGVSWRGNFGLADMATARAVDDSTLFYIASVSKPVTGAALMQLHDRGLFALDDDIDDYLPFAVHHPLFPDSIMTFRMLLSHVSGIDDNWDVMESVMVCDMDSPVALGDFLAEYFTPGGAFYDPDLNFTDSAPGTEYRYSNIGACLAGYLVECILSAIEPGSTLESACQEHLFAPLGMNGTSWFLSGVDMEHLATPYHYENGVQNPLCQLGMPWYPSTTLHTSASELSRFVAAFIRGGELGGARILEPATVDTILTLHYPDLYAYGLLWSGEDWIGLPSWNHGGVFLGTRTLMWLFPEEDVGGIVLTNGESTGGLWDIAERIMTYSIDASTTVAEAAMPDHAAPGLRPGSPNPSRGATTIGYELPAPAAATIKIYDAQGRLVRTLRDGTTMEPAGSHHVRWDGRDDRGYAASAGVYFCRLSAGNTDRANKIVLIR